MTALAFIVGLHAEARLIDGNVFIGSDDARRAVSQAISSGATALVSFGLAGGLSPTLKPGDLMVPRYILSDGQRFAADAALARALGGFSDQSLLAADTIVTEAAAKAALWAGTGADAVDLESGAVAAGASAAGLPFAVLRAVCDPAWRDVPHAAQVALDGAGAIGLGRVLASLARQPGQLAGLLALARDAARARHALVGRMALVRRSGALAAWRDQPGSPPASNGPT